MHTQNLPFFFFFHLLICHNFYLLVSRIFPSCLRSLVDQKLPCKICGAGNLSVILLSGLYQVMVHLAIAALYIGIISALHSPDSCSLTFTVKGSSTVDKCSQCKNTVLHVCWQPMGSKFGC